MFGVDRKLICDVTEGPRKHARQVSAPGKQSKETMVRCVLFSLNLIRYGQHADSDSHGLLYSKQMHYIVIQAAKHMTVRLTGYVNFTEWCTSDIHLRTVNLELKSIAGNLLFHAE